MDDLNLAISCYDPTATYNNVDGTYTNMIWYQPGTKPPESELTTAYNTHINTNAYKKDSWFVPFNVAAMAHLLSIIESDTAIVIAVLVRQQQGQTPPQKWLDFADSYADKAISIQQLIDTAQDELIALSNVTTIATYQNWYDTNLALIEAVA